MSSSVLVLCVVLATLTRTQTIFTKKMARITFGAIGSFLLLLMPLLSFMVLKNENFTWRENLYQVGFSLSSVVLVWKFKDWEKWWSIALLWAVLPVIYVQNELGFWLALMTAEFLLLFAYQEINPNSDYHKYGLLRLMVIFQFFVFEHLFLQNRPEWAGEILASLLLLLYGLALYKVTKGIKSREVIQWLFILAYLQYGIMMFDKLVSDTYLR